jgi:hypothetical protein
MDFDIEGWAFYSGLPSRGQDLTGDSFLPRQVLD